MVWEAREISHEDCENGGVLKHEFLNYGIPFETVPPTTVKKYFRQVREIEETRYV